ncbi:MAG: hypothetical protein KKG59_01450 [Nanoarchaeota archaeon]|nr:hypothetical protein [Nanoarchaeota archaeon]
MKYATLIIILLISINSAFGLTISDYFSEVNPDSFEVFTTEDTNDLSSAYQLISVLNLPDAASIIKTDHSDMSADYVVIIGGPCVNPKWNLFSDETCEAWPYAQGEAIIKVIDQTLLISGTTATDTFESSISILENEYNQDHVKYSSVSPIEEGEVVCTDSDNGLSRFEKGTTKLQIGPRTTVHEDICTDRLHLMEYLCNNGLVIKEHDCTKDNMICVEGKCIKEQDNNCQVTKGSRRAMVKVTIEGFKDNEPFEYSDDCIDDRYIHQVDCVQGEPVFTEFDCHSKGLYKCVNAVCKRGDIGLTCYDSDGKDYENMGTVQTPYKNEFRSDNCLDEYT